MRNFTEESSPKRVFLFLTGKALWRCTARTCIPMPCTQELEGDILALQSKRMAANVRIRELEDRAETCSPEWTGCTKLQVRAPGYQEEV